MFQVSINYIQNHLNYCQKTKLLKPKLLPNSRGDNFDNTRYRILALCSTLHICEPPYYDVTSKDASK